MMGSALTVVIYCDPADVNNPTKGTISGYNYLQR